MVYALKKSAGFTLIELMVTVAIVAVLASVTLPIAELNQQRTKERELREGLREIRIAIDAYKRAVDEGRVVKALDQSGYPPNLSVLVEGVVDARSPVTQKIYFLRKLPANPFSNVPGNPEATWGKRSYDSPPESPREGRDVYDVYALTDLVGLNGVPYREW